MDSDEEDYIYSDDEDIIDDPMELQDEGNSPERRKSTPSLQQLTKEEKFSVFSPKEIEANQVELIKEISTVLGLTEDQTTVILLHFRWDKEKTIEEFYSDAEKTKKEAGVIEKLLPFNFNNKSQEKILCPILFEEFSIRDTYAMGCTTEEFPEPHRFSTEAWCEYLKSKVHEGAHCIFSTCPREKCKAVIPPSVFRELLRTCPKPLDRYQRFLVESYVDLSKDLKWCPTPSCGYAVRAMSGVQNVECSNCRNRFCFRCNHEAHLPVNCILLNTWLEKCQNESETANWILANTKSCPKCNVRIEKNQGCNHMKCSKCQFDFCWVCTKDWKDHGAGTGGYYNCNKFQGGAAEGMDEAARAKRELDRYLHYYRRFNVHDDSGKYAKKQLEEAEKKMLDIQSGKGAGWVEVQFLGDAVRQLIENRRVLKYTYVLAYYLPDGPKKTLFEHNQSDLESYTEKLSELTEKAWEDIDKGEVNNHTRITEKFKNKIIEASEKDGLVDIALEHLKKLETEPVEQEDTQKKRRGRPKKN